MQHNYFYISSNQRRVSSVKCLLETNIVELGTLLSRNVQRQLQNFYRGVLKFVSAQEEDGKMLAHCTRVVIWLLFQVLSLLI